MLKTRFFGCRDIEAVNRPLFKRLIIIDLKNKPEKISMEEKNGLRGVRFLGAQPRSRYRPDGVGTAASRRSCAYPTLFFQIPDAFYIILYLSGLGGGNFLGIGVEKVFFYFFGGEQRQVIFYQHR